MEAKVEAVTTDEAAFLCRRRVDLVTKWCRNGKLPARKDPVGTWVIDLKDLVALHGEGAIDGWRERLNDLRAGKLIPEPPENSHKRFKYYRERRIGPAVGKKRKAKT